MEGMLGVVMHKYREAPWSTPQDMNQLLNDTFLDKGVPMKNYVTQEEDDVFGEYKVDDTSKALEYIDKLKKKGKVAVVSRDTAYQGISDILLYDPKNVQGGEFDYVIIDID